MTRINTYKTWLATLVLALLLPVGALAQDQAEALQDDLISALRGTIAERTDWPVDRITIERLSVPSRVAAAGGFLDIKLPARESLVGHLPFRVEIAGDSGRELVWASARVEVLVDALVSSRIIRRHQVIGPDDLTHARMPLSRLAGGAVTELDQLVGHRAVQRIALGRTITDRMVELPPVIHRGDRVTLIVRRPGLLVTTVGEARQDGAPNHTIQVLNLSSRRTVQGRVVDEGTVEVSF
jgi:flagella basal body P-ring formation protein FlgA